VIVGAAVLPTAPLLVPGMTTGLPDGFPPLREAMDRTLLGLPPHELAVVVAASRDDAEVGVWDDAVASLGGIGRPDLRIEFPATGGAALAGELGLPVRAGNLPLDLSVLTHLVGRQRRLLPICVSAGASAADLAKLGAGIAAGIQELAVVVCAGDLSAGLNARAPLSLVSEARAWDDQVVDAVASGRLDGLARLGPDESLRVGARGWAALAVLHGICRTAKLGTMVRRYAAPRGVGYLVASGG
jgi:hypothetical protein